MTMRYRPALAAAAFLAALLAAPLAAPLVAAAGQTPPNRPAVRLAWETAEEQPPAAVPGNNDEQRQGTDAPVYRNQSQPEQPAQVAPPPAPGGQVAPQPAPGTPAGDDDAGTLDDEAPDPDMP